MLTDTFIGPILGAGPQKFGFGRIWPNLGEITLFGRKMGELWEKVTEFRSIITYSLKENNLQI